MHLPEGATHSRRTDNTLVKALARSSGKSVLTLGIALAGGLPMALSLPVFLFAFIGLYLADMHAVREGLAPQWYPALRKPLTLAVCLSLLVAWASVLTH